MARRRKIFLWPGMVLSLLATGYGGTSFIFYAWLSAAAPDRWPPDRAAVWTFSALVLTILFFGLFVYCAVALVKEANRRYRDEKNAT